MDATESAQSMIEQGTMTGTVRQDAAGMALCVADVTVNLIDGMTMKEAIATVAARNPSYTVAAGIPVKLFIAYAPYTGQ